MALNLNVDGSGDVEGDYGADGNNMRSGNDGFIDRSRVRILLCDNDSKSSEEVLALLLKCSYQVTSVRSARQVINALNAEGPDIDIILAEVDLPMAKGMKMLKYITRDKELQRIPVIMMSAQDEVSIVVKCLRLGAADYLVKPLRTNELLNLWTHMWRRRRMIGLAEKNILHYDFDLVGSDPSDANTNSTTLFSDDTDDKSRRSTNPEPAMPTLQENELSTAVAEPSLHKIAVYRPDVPRISDRWTGQFSSVPKKSKLKVGESSAFFTYVKSSFTKSSPIATGQHNANGTPDMPVEEQVAVDEEHTVYNVQSHENVEAWEKSSQGDDFRSVSSLPDSLSVERSCTPPGSTEYLHSKNFMEEKVPEGYLPPRSEHHLDVSGFSAHGAYPYYMSGVNQVMMPSSAQMYQKNLHDMQNHATPPILPQYNHLPHCPSHMRGMASYPYYPMGVCLPPGQISSAHTWPSFGSSSATEAKANKVDRREAALIKFRQKRKERSFDKKIRYVNRKKLAERRPRVRGQFVRKVNGVTVDLNGEPASGDYDEDEIEDEEELVSRDDSPENDES